MMKIGLLWYCEDETIEKGIMDAAKRYFDKFGVKPNTAYINPKNETKSPIEGLEIRFKATVFPNHVWIGVAE